ncbi:hypothetical protein CMI47_16460 [Candidatus Pacearchaeota archaeon]|nr:hypothetical protein [Candidatus Pacearchaeota archaeon]|tara:strand:- start:158 stop:418 length:261 start_codon:yes stop_codon:yes gene_type:complete
MPTHDETGLGVPKLLEGRAVRIVANDVTGIKYNTLRITGKESGSTWLINIIVNPGDRVLTIREIPGEVLEYYEGDTINPYYTPPSF